MFEVTPPSQVKQTRRRQRPDPRLRHTTDPQIAGAVDLRRIPTQAGARPRLDAARVVNALRYRVVGRPLHLNAAKFEMQGGRNGGAENDIYPSKTRGA